MQKKLVPGKLLDKKGRLNQKGYATSLILDYNRSDVKANGLRIKEWDYYLIYNDRFGVALTLDDNSYMGLVSISFLDFVNKKERTVSPMMAFPMGGVNMPSSSAEGNVSYRSNKVQISFKKEKKRRIINAQMRDFERNVPIRIKVELFDEPKDSMVIATPFPGNEKAFYYNQKIVGMRARGAVYYMGQAYTFEPENSFGLLDWGRGVWTYNNTWYWSAAHGIIDGHVFGFNLGYSFGDTSAASENMLFYDGKAHKLEKVRFIIPGDDQGKPDYLNKWKFVSSDGRLLLSFTPILDRKAYTSAGIILSDQHQVFGHFDGEVTLDDGRVLKLEHFLGFAEKVRNKW